MTLTKSKLFRPATAIAMWGLVIACFVWGKDVLASPAGPTVRIVLCVLCLAICVRCLYVAGKYVYIAFTDKAEGKDKIGLIVLCVGAVAFILHFVFQTMRFGETLERVAGWLT